MPYVAKWFTHAGKILTNGTVAGDTDTFKLALITSAYTFSAAHTQFADLSTNEATGTGYTAGGATIASTSITDPGIQGTGPTFTALDTTYRFACLYANVTRNGLTDPVIWVFEYQVSATPTDRVVAGEDHVVSFHANGMIPFVLDATLV